MSPVHSSPFFQMENPAILSLLRHKPGDHQKRTKSTGGLLKMFKIFPMLTSGCKMVALLGRPRKPLLKDNATTGTLFGYRKGRVSLAIQEDPHCMPIFVIELPMHSSAFQKEMASDMVRIALESETKTHKKKLLEEFVWAVYCNGRKTGYSIRRKQMSEDELYVMQHLRGVSMSAGVLPNPSEKETADGELTYMRARFERVVGSKDSEALYMINPDGAAGPELSIFFVRAH
ncbi:protein MIZU-KUSSEI 1-like [Juglans microcarpa x Juglans regia]|uniref:protein MIZU-KUSSEI 1-like n=1 Tax=Juglans microcarpa x Juglans regia TaxID=2249226 RepID=UPI001B7E8C1D|nr:protein MIZU-KUSSEI 1-like [Juglans microcarpa x Juglans regia]